MLDEREWAAFHPILSMSLERTKQIRATTGVSLKEARPLAYRAAFDEYERITGFRETNIDALWHHQASLYGPPCNSCGKPLRTPHANQCVECGADRDHNI